MIVIHLARKPIEGTVAENVLRYGTGGLNVDRCRIATAPVDDYGRSAAGKDGVKAAHPGFEGKSFAMAARTGERALYASDLGRWPANLILSISAAADLEQQEDGVSRYFNVVDG